ncbi:MAG: glycosyltransferase [Chloroflexi bacterium]|nr:glycosyltransferase [Chloroflexota bacterium]MBU1750212.1 glycosyltransferase [Chloroflexota bacterium]
MPNGAPWPLVSVVTPSYNQSQFIEETIRSVLLQGYPNLEYMVIDGGSTDNSVEIIRKYDPWLAYWASEPDRGQSHAINKGWERSRGQVLAYLNSDDILEPDTLHRVVKTFQASPEAAVVYGDGNLVDGDGRLIRRLGAQDYNRANLMLVDYIHQPSAFVRRSAFESVGMLDESLHMCMDYEYWVRLALAGFNMIYLPEVLSSARLTPNTKTGSLALRFLDDTMRVLDTVYENEHVPEDLRRVRSAAYGHAWRLGGVRYFDAGKRHLAIAAMFKSLRCNPIPGYKSWAVIFLITLQAACGVHWWSPRTMEKWESIS